MGWISKKGRWKRLEDVTIARLLILKALLETFPECRAFARGYLVWYLRK